MSRSGSVSEASIANICGSCNGEVLGGEKTMQCEWCNKWIHNTCCGMPEEIYKNLVKFEKKCSGLKWFCKFCEKHFGKLKMEMQVMSEKQLMMESKHEGVEKNVSVLMKEVGDLKREFSEFVKQKQNEENNGLKVDDKIDQIKG